MAEIERLALDGTHSGSGVNGTSDLSAYLIRNPLLSETSRPVQAVYPKDVAELQRIMIDANASKTSLVPVSSRNIHIKGGICCAEPHTVVDLSRWNKVLWVNRRNRVAMIEPGVTYGELSQALDREGLSVPMPLAPRSGKSVVAALMDREPGTWPNKQWDAMDPVASTEFVFGTGDLFRTGSAAGPGSIEAQRKNGGAQKAPQGPGQTDFARVVSGSQGSMGIVTWISVRAELKPTIERPLLIGTRTLEQVIPYIYDVQRPWLGEHSFVLNRTAAAMLMTYPRSADFEKVRHGLPEYICLQNIAGFERLPKQRVDQQFRDIEDKAKTHGLALVKSLGTIAGTSLLDAARSPCGEEDWRHRQLGHCVSVFFLTTLDRVPSFVTVVKNVAKHHGIDDAWLGSYVQPVVQNHGCHVEFMIPYSPGKDEELRRMVNFEKEAVAELTSCGAYFSRPYGTAAQTAFEANSVNTGMIKQIKGIFDPNRILNPGKFGI